MKWNIYHTQLSERHVPVGIIGGPIKDPSSPRNFTATMYEDRCSWEEVFELNNNLKLTLNCL